MKKLSDMSIIVGKEVQLQTTIEGAEPISVTWFKDKGEVIRESDNIWISYSENIATLQLSRVETANAGKYTCQIKNDAGMQECFATLSILGECTRVLADAYHWVGYILGSFCLIFTNCT